MGTSWTACCDPLLSLPTHATNGSIEPKAAVPAITEIDAKPIAPFRLRPA